MERLRNASFILQKNAASIWEAQLVSVSLIGNRLSVSDATKTIKDSNVSDSTENPTLVLVNVKILLLLTAKVLSPKFSCLFLTNLTYTTVPFNFCSDKVQKNNNVMSRHFRTNTSNSSRNG